MNIVMLLSSIVFLLDRIIKTIVTISLDLEQGIIIIDNFFTIMHVHNYGAAFSILNGNRIFLIVMTFLFLGVIYFYFIKDKELRKLEKIGLGLLIGGVVGNLFDRLFLGYVIDYLSFDIFGYPFPVFNLADACIVLAVLLIMIDIWKEDN